MPTVINSFQRVTEDGIVEIEEFSNGMIVESLTDPSVAYLEKEAIDRAEGRTSFPIPEPTKLELLQADNTSLWYESMIQSSRVEANETEVANLWYELMMGGM